MSTPDLAAWLLEQVAADEAAAKSSDEDGESCYECMGASGEGVPDFNSERVRAECVAKREVLSIIERLGGHYEPNAGREARGILLALAQPYADRPGWREEWRL